MVLVADLKETGGSADNAGEPLWWSPPADTGAESGGVKAETKSVISCGWLSAVIGWRSLIGDGGGM